MCVIICLKLLLVHSITLHLFVYDRSADAPRNDVECSDNNQIVSLMCPLNASADTRRREDVVTNIDSLSYRMTIYKTGCHLLPIHTNISSRLIANIRLCMDYRHSADQETGLYKRQNPPNLHGFFAVIPGPESRSDSATNMQQLVTKDSLFREWVKRVWGPNLFRLRLVGPEVLLLKSTFTAQNASQEEPREHYMFPFQLFRTGHYSVEFEWLYHNYNAVDEERNRWPPLIKQSLLPTLPLKTRYHIEQCTLPSTIVLEVNDHRNLVDQLTHGGDAEHQRRLCNGMEPYAGGRWLMVKHPDPQQHDRSFTSMKQTPSVMTRVRVRKIRKRPIRFEYALQEEKERFWEPAQCRLLTYPFSTVESRLIDSLRGAKIVVIGDSQARALYYGLVNILNGNELLCVRNITVLEDEPQQCIPNVKGSVSRTIRRIQIDFVADNFLDSLSNKDKSLRYVKYDVIIAGFAQHPASSKHWPLGKYRQKLLKRITYLQHLAAGLSSSNLFSAGGGRRLVLWYAAPQYPHSTTGYPVEVKDWRTDARLRIFNDFAFLYASATWRDANDTQKDSAATIIHRTNLHAFPLSQDEKAFIFPSRESTIDVGAVRYIDAQEISGPFSHTSADQAHYSNFVSVQLSMHILTVVCSAGGLKCDSAF